MTAPQKEGREKDMKRETRRKMNLHKSFIFLVWTQHVKEGSDCCISPRRFHGEGAWTTGIRYNRILVG